MRAKLLLRDTDHYRVDAFRSGLESVGYKVCDGFKPGPDDLIVAWNRYPRHEPLIAEFEAAGGRAVIAENGWLGYKWRGGTWFALSLGHHAGAGTWPVGGPERWDSWSVDLLPWHADGERVILQQRGFGEPGIAAPDRWAERIGRRFPGRIRLHPGNGPSRPLEVDLAAAGEVLTWNSGAALSALILGVPVRCAFPAWIGMQASCGLDDPLRRDDEARLAMFRRLAWAQWTADEVGSGDAFRSLLG